MRFALISDEHFGPTAYFQGKLRKLTAQAGKLCEAFVARMNEEVHPDLVVNLGDVIEDESRAADLEQYGQFVAILSKLKSPVLHVAGNHDQVNLSDDDLRRLWNHPGELHYSRDVAGVHFSVLRTIEVTDVAIHLPEAQIEWLRADLAQSDLPSVVLMHHPASEMRLDGNRWFENRPNVCRVAERRDLRGFGAAVGSGDDAGCCEGFILAAPLNNERRPFGDLLTLFTVFHPMVAVVG